MEVNTYMGDQRKKEWLLKLVREMINCLINVVEVIGWLCGKKIKLVLNLLLFIRINFKWIEG